MRRAALLCYVLIAWMGMSAAAIACAYPASLQPVNKTLSEQVVRGGEVSMFVRNTLRRALERMPPGAMLATLDGEVSRADLRAVRAVLEVAAIFADGRGRSVDPDLRAATAHVEQAVKLACADGAQGITGATQATEIEHGNARKVGGFGRALTFKEGMTRLSIAFFLYAVFLGCLFAFRQFYRHQRPPPVAGPAVIGAPKPSPQIHRDA